MKSLLTYLYYLICIVISVLMTIQQLHIYFENEDSTSATQRSFYQSQANKYPDISVCVSFDGRKQFNETKLKTNIRSVDLSNMFNGNETNEEHISQNTIAMRQLLHDLSQNDSFFFEDLLKENAKNVIAVYGMHSTFPMQNGENIYLGSSDNKNLEKSFESNTFRCWTRKLDYSPGQVVKGEGMSIAKGVLENTQMLIISLHQKNQLIRTTTNINVYETLYIKPGAQKLPIFVLTVNNIKIINKRHDSKEKCDLNLNNDDDKFFQTASKMMGCVPVFWKKFALSWMRTLNMTFCKELEKYKNYYTNLGLNWDKRYQVFKKYQPPCTKVSVTYDISTKEDDEFFRSYIKIPGDLMIRMIYGAEDYEEVFNLRKFNAESAFSQIGGLIGIMIGVSLFNIPDILTSMIFKVQELNKKRSSGDVPQSTKTTRRSSTTKLVRK